MGAAPAGTEVAREQAVTEAVCVRERGVPSMCVECLAGLKFTTANLSRCQLNVFARLEIPRPSDWSPVSDC